ncbi:hypothetical protein [Mycoplasmopsis synoviae]|uniref:Uncharacterized protein n=1 Tax=Mycoplasmopsis synoviae (strain 53) TaxID=262723 RepID=Q4A5W7_MYCS5|nr:hypothetical protein [Mycoplasmopsis synoviae]AAZ43854.2 hypothetical protein MS53_0707 [Mycoplasmopsis synoviae 53]AKB11179.1 hypothetical protein VY93_02390 [Mycoplasmopsis synoviae ATCC 25204]AKJ20668.1 hypothetical protein MSHv_01910 [Mycoplasmopsis synoviae]AQU47988.1 hypothetical protein ADF19_01910 [Mycoplasmopsis synoviae]AWL84230.1 hypothetical protein MSH_02255 [Mycoplasmopsis synoviae]
MQLINLDLLYWLIKINKIPAIKPLIEILKENQNDHWSYLKSFMYSKNWIKPLCLGYKRIPIKIEKDKTKI